MRVLLQILVLLTLMAAVPHAHAQDAPSSDAGEQQLEQEVSPEEGGSAAAEQSEGEEGDNEGGEDGEDDVDAADDDSSSVGDPVEGAENDPVFATDRDQFFEQRGTRDPDSSEKPIEAMNESELRDAGFVFSDRDRSDLGSTGTILALTVGSAVHGVGHLYVGDTTTGLFLMGMEAASILSILSAVVYAVASGNDDGGIAVSSSLFKLGVAGFFSSWALDILGTLQGDELVFPLNRGPELGMHASIGYRLVDVDGTPMRHGFDAGIGFDNDYLQVEAGTTQDVLLNMQQYHALVGSRPFVAGSRLTWLGADARGTYTRYTGFGEFGHLDVSGRLNFSIGMLALSTSLDQISLGGSLGWGLRYIQVPSTENVLEAGPGRGRLVFDLHGEMGVTDRLSARVGYRNTDGILFPAESPFVGITYTDLVYRSAGFGDLILGAGFGNGLMLTAGGRLWLWR